MAEAAPDNTRTPASHIHHLAVEGEVDKHRVVAEAVHFRSESASAQPNVSAWLVHHLSTGTAYTHSLSLLPLLHELAGSTILPQMVPLQALSATRLLRKVAAERMVR